MALVGEVKGYPETCAEHGLSRSTSAPASSLSGFFSIFFSKYARARSTDRGGRPAVHARMKNEIVEHNYEISSYNHIGVTKVTTQKLNSIKF